MTVYELLFMAIEDSDPCKVWSFKEKEEADVFEGTIEDVKEKFGEHDVLSWEVSENGVFAVNVKW